MNFSNTKVEWLEKASLAALRPPDRGFFSLADDRKVVCPGAIPGRRGTTLDTLGQPLRWLRNENKDEPPDTPTGLELSSVCPGAGAGTFGLALVVFGDRLRN